VTTSVPGAVRQDGGTGLAPSAPPPAAPSRRSRGRFDLLPYLLVAPVAIFIIGLALVPAVFTIVESFFTVDELDPACSHAGSATANCAVCSPSCSATTRSPPDRAAGALLLGQELGQPGLLGWPLAGGGVGQQHALTEVAVLALDRLRV